MGDKRKLQTEIERTLKKVQEGVEVFDGIWNKGARTHITSVSIQSARLRVMGEDQMFLGS
eukprot:6381679-Pyramimonas_sp.AAC.1